jgi:hypothetical protein
MKEKLQQELFNSIARHAYLDDGLKDYLFFLTDEVSNYSYEEQYRKECEILRTRYSIYRSYLDTHYCNPKNRVTGDNVNFLTSFKELLKEVDYSLLNTSDVPHSAILRIKSLTHFTEKSWRNSAPSSSEVHDLIAFSFVLSGNNPKQYVHECYNYAISLKKLMENYGFRLEPAKEPKGLAKRESIESLGIYVPEIDEIPELFSEVSNGLKDYIRNPKANGYQGLHMVFFNPLQLTYAECQIKTEIMEEHANFGEANHELYKDINATGLIDIDLSKFNGLHGFKSDENGNVITDKIGFDIARKYNI